MTEASRIRVQLQGEKALVRILMNHEMESGQRRDAAGKLVPAWYIQEVSVTHNGRVVLTADWGPAVSKSPYLQFTLKSAKAGDRIGVSWRDNRNASRSDEASVLGS
ncbi:thiosulfate oxidation carrier complex protein SoxZ [Roseateles sp.]|uniref:thiosulfate oxidation carrier complex protein SoxZ n=1 Tax=Roseateles sp. TaxID=1971397 RepID=UPI003BA4E13C